jgi:hypothetical protein
MALQKVILADLHNEAIAYDYINPGLIASVDITATYYLVVLGNKIEYRVALNDVAITALITTANTAYVPPV